MTRWTFDAIREKRGEPIAVFHLTAHPERTIESFSINPDPLKVAVWKISDEFEGGIIIYCTWGDGKDAEWHPNSGHRQLVVHLLADRDRLRSELDAARAELARVRLAYIRQIERRAAKHCDEWAQVIRSMGCWDLGSYQGRRLTRIRNVRDACRAELARMVAP